MSTQYPEGSRFPPAGDSRKEDVAGSSPAVGFRRLWRTSSGSRLPALFLFFSNRSGCLGSIIVSVIGTLILLILLGVFNTN
jgi:hypothetical protein